MWILSVSSTIQWFMHAQPCGMRQKMRWLSFWSLSSGTNVSFKEQCGLYMHVYNQCLHILMCTLLFQLCHHLLSMKVSTLYFFLQSINYLENSEFKQPYYISHHSPYMMDFENIFIITHSVNRMDKDHAMRCNVRMLDNSVKDLDFYNYESKWINMNLVYFKLVYKLLNTTIWK